MMMIKGLPSSVGHRGVFGEMPARPRLFSAAPAPKRPRHLRVAPAVPPRVRTSRLLCRGSASESLEDLRLLRAKLDIAVSSEDFSSAATLRDRIQAMEARDPIISLEAQLRQAVEEERYADAAALRDRLQELRPPPPEKPPVPPTSSCAVTEGIKVEVDW